MEPLLVASAIFFLTYAAITSEKIHRTLAALLGAAAMLVFGVLDEQTGLQAIDFHTIGLLVGMMIIVSILRKTGCFHWLAIKTVKLARGDPWRIMAGFFLLTAVASAFLDNVTTILLVVPMTLLIAETLTIDPLPFLITEILASNIGGTATLIGDPPNIMIGSRTGLSFLQFLTNLGPVVLVISVVVLVGLFFTYRRQLKTAHDLRQIADELEEEGTITDPVLLKKSLIVLALVIIGFFLHGWLGWQASTVALIGAVLLILLSALDPHEILAEVEWSTIFFFMGLFIVVGGVEQAGLLHILAEKMVAITGGNILLTCMAILWFSAILSAIVDNIPCTAALIPVIQNLAELLPHSDITPLWWALALGACLGGNGSLIAASANVVAAGIADRAGHPISFARFLRVGIPYTAISLIIASLYVYFRYLH